MVRTKNFFRCRAFIFLLSSVQTLQFEGLITNLLDNKPPPKFTTFSTPNQKINCFVTMTDSAASTSLTIRPNITWKEYTLYNCRSCEFDSLNNTDPSKVVFVDMIDPRFSDQFCMDCCMKHAYDFDNQIMNASAYLQERFYNRMMERLGSPYEWNETYKNLWFPAEVDGTVWNAYLGDHYPDGTMMITRMKVKPIDWPEAEYYNDIDEDDDVMEDDEDDFVPPPSTPLPMPPLLVCPDAPVKPKEDRTLKVNPFSSGPARIVWFNENSYADEQRNLGDDLINE